MIFSGNSFGNERIVRHALGKFTLIELIVVVSVIAILASLLLPALNKSRMTAKKITCTSMLKIYLTGAHMYASDFNGSWVPIWRRDDGVAWQNNPMWRTYIGADYAPDLNSSILPVYLLCPDSRGAINARSLKAWGYPSVPPRGNYGSAQESYGVTYNDVWSTTRVFRLEQLKRSSSSMAWGDGLDWLLYSNNLPDYFVGGENAPGNGRVAYRHTNTLNVGMFDGHVENFGYLYLHDPANFKKLTEGFY